MKLSSIYLFSFALCFVARSVSCSQTFLYEKKHNFGLGNRAIPNYRRMHGKYAYPEPLPTSVLPMVHFPISKVYQGRRITNDTRVYRKSFDFKPKSDGHHILCQALFDCIITHVAVESKEGIPIILRGGAGYRYFNIVIKARPGDQLTGSVRAYCKKKNENV